MVQPYLIRQLSDPSIQVVRVACNTIVWICKEYPAEFSQEFNSIAKLSGGNGNHYFRDDSGFPMLIGSEYKQRQDIAHVSINEILEFAPFIENVMCSIIPFVN